MVNLLFLLATAQAADVYEICVIKKQEWIERDQVFVDKLTRTYYSSNPVQMIFYDGIFELERDKRKIKEIFTIDDMKCYREHENSFICLDEVKNKLYWEYNLRNGTTKRDVLSICFKNGQPV